MIIECPTCKTRFSVDDDHVARIENPRFHCSRCDHYFYNQAAKAEEKNAEEKIIPAEVSTQEQVTNTDYQDYLFNQEHDDDIDEIQYSASTTQSGLGDLNQVEEKKAVKESNFTKEVLFNEERPQVFASWPDQQTTTTFETNIGIEQSEFIRTNIFQEKIVQSKVINEIPSPAVIPRVLEEEAGELDYGIRTNELRLEAENERSKMLSDLSKRNLLQRKSNSILAAFYSYLIFLSVPLLAFLGIFFWSQNLDRTPPMIKGILGIESGNFPFPPPLGLDVIDLQSKFINLDNQVRALEIRGMVYNATSKTYEDIMIDSRLFSDENKLLDRIIINSNNKITNAKIEALSAEAILDLQKSKPNVQIKISPKDKIPFRVVFFPYDLKEKVKENIKWFSTRVYSTRTITS